MSKRGIQMMVRMRSIAVAAVVLSGLAASENLVASTCSSSVIEYEASGTFGSTIVSGLDKYELAGKPFNIFLFACESKAPSRTGPDYAVYSGVELAGYVKSGRTAGTIPFRIAPTSVNLILVKAATGDDTVEMKGTLTIGPQQLPIQASVGLPAGTLTSLSIAPFSKVAIATTGSDLTYSAPPWQASHSYSGGEILDPSGNAQEVSGDGTSGTTAPAWNDTVGGTTTDGTVVWTCIGHYTPTELSMNGTASAIIYTAPFR